jgi:iron-sulfur cluster repair protein YtfE (RIC family)
MKRHIALQPLSREHHQGLLLAQLLRNDAPDYRGLPTDLPGKIQYAIEQFQQLLLPHFKKEEILFQKSTGLHADLDSLIKDAIAEHTTLQKLFAALKEGTTDSHKLHTIGTLLYDHIRREERLLFPLLEHHCPPALLEQFRLLL